MKPEIPTTNTETLDDLMARCKSPEDFHALTKTLFKQVAERALQAEMADHLGYDKHNVS